MMDRIIGIAALALLVGFMGILIGFVPEIDLGIVLTVVVVMAGYDFYRSLFPRQNGGQ